MTQNIEANPQNVTITHSSSTTFVTTLQQHQPEPEEDMALQIENVKSVMDTKPQQSQLPPPLPPLLSLRSSIIQSSLIIPFSILGLLIRLGLVSIETFSGQQVFELAWPQFVGCILLGLFVKTRPWIDQGFVWDSNSSGKIGHWIGTYSYVALSSGLCGSITTFSSWSLGMFSELINTAKVSRHPLQNILSALTELSVTLALSITGLQFGMHLGDVFFLLKPKINSSETSNAPTIPKPPPKWTLFDFGVILFGVALWIGMIIA
ncbi:hypothetical protein BGZ76_011399, partial [Entomortierella beljakovae]